MYGLGGLPESFSRLCAIHGGTFMLNKGIDEVLFDSNGVAWGVKTGNEVRSLLCNNQTLFMLNIRFYRNDHTTVIPVL
jgi:RAB protein geranylgeranyltransferase component A